jgi:CBS domain containing-hemolysin-like protein
MDTLLKLVSIILLVLANGFFVAAEFAFVSIRRTRVETLVEEGNRQAKRLLGILDNMNVYLSACQLGITLASLGLGWVGESTIAHILERPLAGISDAWRHLISIFIGFTIITSLHIVLGEQAPKLIGLQRAERIALSTALPMKIFFFLLKWPIYVLDWASVRTTRLLGLRSSETDHSSIYTADELRHLVEASHRSGHLEEEERELIDRAFNFSETEVLEAMVPRTAITALPITATLEEVEEAFCSLGYSRIPVYRNQLDNIVGVLFMKDIMPYLRHSNEDEFQLEKLLHPPTFVPATAKLGNVLEQMQASRSHLAFVVDEHGGIEGIVTLEDLLEEIVGEINDEYDEEAREQIVEENGTYVIDGMLAVRDANKYLKLKLPEEAGYTTLAGFLMAEAGRLLRAGESIDYDGARFVVERVERRRIRRIRLIPATTENREAAA